MKAEIIVNCTHRETRIAVLENGQLMEYRAEREERVVGSIFKGIVQNVLPGMDAAFVDIGLERNAFLYVGDIIPMESHDNSPASIRRSELRRREIGQLLKPGQEIMVQVIKGPRGTKGARVTTQISLPGRYLVFLPASNRVGISRKTEDRAERDRLKAIAEKFAPEGCGVIMRTEAEGRTEEEIYADLRFLLQLSAQLFQNAKKIHAPACVHRDQTLLYRTLRDSFTGEISKMVIDDPDEYEKMYMVASAVAPNLIDKTFLYDQEEPIFDYYKIENELDRLLQHHVPLKSGGYLVIDETEALTAVDVNTGKQVGTTSLKETILKANLEAAVETCRQLRLRDMGGMIVIDFIDMEDEKSRKKVLDLFKEHLARDRARTRVGKISSLGLVEITRKRTGESVTESITDVCPMCDGRGRTPSKETVSLWIERDLQRSNAEQGDAFFVECHPTVAECIVGPDGVNLENLEHELNRAVYVRANFDLGLEEYDITPGAIQEFEKQKMGYSRSQVIECLVKRSEIDNAQRPVGWTDNGYLVNLANGMEHLGRRVKVCLHDIRRSYAVGDVILSSSGSPGSGSRSFV